MEGMLMEYKRTKGCSAEAWVSCQGGLHVFVAYFWHSQDWSPRNEALMESVISSATGSKGPLIVACDGTMELAEFQQGERD